MASAPSRCVRGPFQMATTSTTSGEQWSVSVTGVGPQIMLDFCARQGTGAVSVSTFDFPSSEIVSQKNQRLDLGKSTGTDFCRTQINWNFGRERTHPASWEAFSHFAALDFLSCLFASRVLRDAQIGPLGGSLYVSSDKEANKLTFQWL